MPFNIHSTIISDLKPSKVGGIVYIDSGEVNFNYIIATNITSSTYAACFYISNSKIKIKRCCFTKCAGNAGNEAFGNVGYVLTSSAVITDFSALFCSFSISQCADSLLFFKSCGSLIDNFNSSFCYGCYGAAIFRSDQNVSTFDARFITCLSGIDFSFLENYHVMSFESCAFINSTQVTNYMIIAEQNSVFDTCYFFQMTTKTLFWKTVVMKNCFADKEISGYSLTTYSKIEEVDDLYTKKLICKRKMILSRQRYYKKQISLIHCVVLVLTS